VAPASGFPWFRVQRLRADLLWNLPAALLLKALRHVHYKWSTYRPRPNKEYARIDAEVFLCFGVNAASAEAIVSCRRYGKKSVLFLASDSSLSTRFRPHALYRDGEGVVGNAAYLAITQADRVLVQTATQQRLLRERFGRESTVIRNPIDLPQGRNGDTLPRGFILWIGRADRHSKRPLLCLELARHCPGIPFLMILNPRDPEVAAEVQRTRPDNVRIIEWVPHAEVDGLFRGARALINTSSMEGFPNTFLQAGKWRAAVLSLEVDPDEMLQREGCGLVAGGDLDRLAGYVRTVWSDPSTATRLIERMTDYIQRYHALEGRVAELEAVLQSMF
jgi:glycosyltransferase involved in cell wall biosynthesis